MATLSMEKNEKYHKYGSSEKEGNEPNGTWLTILGIAIAVVVFVTEILNQG